MKNKKKFFIVSIFAVILIVGFVFRVNVEKVLAQAIPTTYTIFSTPNIGFTFESQTNSPPVSNNQYMTTLNPGGLPSIVAGGNFNGLLYKIFDIGYGSHGFRIKSYNLQDNNLISRLSVTAPDLNGNYAGVLSQYSTDAGATWKTIQNQNSAPVSAYTQVLTDTYMSPYFYNDPANGSYSLLVLGYGGVNLSQSNPDSTFGQNCINPGFGFGINPATENPTQPCFVKIGLPNFSPTQDYHGTIVLTKNLDSADYSDQATIYYCYKPSYNTSNIYLDWLSNSPAIYGSDTYNNGLVRIYYNIDTARSSHFDRVYVYGTQGLNGHGCPIYQNGRAYSLPIATIWPNELTQRYAPNNNYYNNVQH